MSAVLCNNPSIVAYSVHWDTRIMSIHTHTLKEELSMYQNRDNGIWLFFPLYRNEKVVEVWIRGSERLDLALLVRAIIYEKTYTDMCIVRNKPRPNSGLWSASEYAATDAACSNRCATSGCGDPNFHRKIACRNTLCSIRESKPRDGVRPFHQPSTANVQDPDINFSNPLVLLDSFFGWRGGYTTVCAQYGWTDQDHRPSSSLYRWP